MKNIVVHDCNNNAHVCTVYNVYDFPYEDIIRNAPIVKNRTNSYFNIPCAFDIETYSVSDRLSRPYGYMYQWQFCMNDTVIFGRTWEEFKNLILNLQHYANDYFGVNFVIYAHNLAFEFQHIYNFLKITSMFSRSKNTPLYVKTAQKIEWRCSYLLTNMSLDLLCKNTPNCIFWKKTNVGYDYTKYRTPYTPLTEEEEEYCYCDVRGLCECLSYLLQEDTLATIPLTSTGYVRRIYRDNMKKNPKNKKLIKKLSLDCEQYSMCKRAFRGGNSSSNTLYVNELLSEIDSYDLKSSYPAWLELEKFPMSKFTKVTIDSKEKFYNFISRYACLMDITIEGLQLKNLNTIPYIDIAHAREIKKGRFGNGRILSADRLTLTITDIDYKIIESTYKIEKRVVTCMYVAKYDYLPKEFRETLADMFFKKCQLDYEVHENKSKYNDEEYNNVKILYGKEKNKVNGSFGMTVTDITSPEIIFDSDREIPWYEEDIDIETALTKYYNKNSTFLAYQWGVWTTAHARKHLQHMMNICSEHNTYSDTDSLKIKDITEEIKGEFNRVNRETIEKLRSSDINLIPNINGKEYFLGTWEHEETYKYFKTLGSKKYLVEHKNGEMELTVAGVNKRKGSKYFQEKGFEHFRDGEVIPYQYCNRMEVWYNYEKPYTLICDDGIFTTSSNIAMLEGEYTLGLTEEYNRLVKEIKFLNQINERTI